MTINNENLSMAFTRNEENLIMACKCLLQEIADISYSTGIDYGVYIDRKGNFKFDNEIAGINIAKAILEQVLGKGIKAYKGKINPDTYNRTFGVKND